MRGIRLFKILEGSLFETRVSNTLNNINKKLQDSKIVKLNFYINSNSTDDFINSCDAIQTIAKDIYKHQVPALTFISLESVDHKELMIECQSIKDPECTINYKSILKHNYVTISHPNGVELISGGIQFNEDSFLMSVQRSFDFAEQLLMAEDMNFGHIYRQWNFIPNILKHTTFEGKEASYYDLFNEIKQFFFEDALFKNGYPVNTIAGSTYGNVILDFNAFNNYQSVLSFNEPEQLFAQGKLLNLTNQEIWFRTSSSPVLNIKEQTLQSLMNITALIEKITLEQKNIAEQNIQLLKIYIKNMKDNALVKEILKTQLPQTAVLLFNTDNYKEDLLIEMEGITSNTMK
jgi:enamine deaminase RidA (YjgF/YER057c/UK114 family)